MAVTQGFAVEQPFRFTVFDILEERGLEVRHDGLGQAFPYIMPKVEQSVLIGARLGQVEI